MCSPLRVQIFQHVPYEGPAAIEPYLIKRGHKVEVIQWFAGQLPEAITETDALIVMGGPMSVSDEESFPWLKLEKAAIAEALRLDVPLLGICLGAQLLAEVLGAQVNPMGYREIGWFPVETNQEFLDQPLGNSFPKRFTPLQWHGDSFDIPAGCISLGSSQACKNQGFIYSKKQIGLQFHLEFDQSSVQRLATNAADELDGTEFVQSEQQMLAKEEFFIEADQLLDSFLDDFLGLCTRAGNN